VVGTKLGTANSGKHKNLHEYSQVLPRFSHLLSCTRTTCKIVPGGADSAPSDSLFDEAGGVFSGPGFVKAITRRLKHILLSNIST
jgi:hypothetical protein